MDTRRYYDEMMQAQQQGKQEEALRIAEEAARAKTSVEVMTIQGQVVLAFGDRVESIGMTPRLAQDIAYKIQQAAARLTRPEGKRQRHKKH